MHSLKSWPGSDVDLPPFVGPAFYMFESFWGSPLHTMRNFMRVKVAKFQVENTDSLSDFHPFNFPNLHKSREMKINISF